MREESTDVWARAERATLIPVAIDVAWVALESLIAELWPGATEVLHREAGILLLHSVAVEPGGEPDAWLSWSLEPVNASATRVVLLHEEQACAAPGPELDQVLVLLIARCCVSPQPTDGNAATPGGAQFPTMLGELPGAS